LPDAPEAEEARRPAWELVWPSALFLVITVFVALDLAADLRIGMSALHVGAELVSLGVALTGVVGTAWQLRGAVGRARALQRDLRTARADLDRWRCEAEGLLHRLGGAIEAQLLRWELTSAESEIALLILKGLSYKEIASARGTTERTVRHQALAIFKKAGLAGRAEMSAFFLQDLLLPADATKPPNGSRVKTSDARHAKPVDEPVAAARPYAS
jgi:DNA-binding CsgD family transcriptional regulator